MDNKTLIILGAIALGYFFITSGNRQQKWWYNGQWLTAQQLQAMGLQQVGNQWYSQQQINYAYQQAGVNPNTQVNEGTSIWYDIVMVLNTLTPIITNIITLVTSTNKPQAIQQILDCKTNPSSPYYVPMYQYTQQDLEAMTNSQLQAILDTCK